MVSREIVGSSIQRSDEWFEARKGRLTGSKMNELINHRGQGLPARADDYLIEKAMEIVTGYVTEVPDNEYMRWGREQEDDAIMLLEDYVGTRVYPTGAICMPWSDRVAISPDGIGYNDGKFIVESKSPMTKNHIKYIMGGKVPTIYKAQVQAEMMATEADFGYFMTYDPRAKGMEGYILKVQPDEALQKKIKTNCEIALEKIDKHVNTIRSKGVIDIGKFYKGKEM